jgi:hypothetical protein
VMRAYSVNPTEVFVVARVVASVLGTLAVWLTYLAGARFFSRGIGLLGAAIFAFAFLPVFYSHLALNDVPALAPVALSLYGISGVVRNGSRRDYMIAGVGIGFAAATKYTAGITILCLLAAFVFDAAGGSVWTASRRCGLALLTALLAFVVGNPYSVLDWGAFHSGLTQQASLAAGADPVKLGTTAGSGTAYYLWTLTWGLGWVPTLAAVGGAALLVLRRRIALALVLIPAPIAYIIFIGDQQRFFGRWLMPIFPILVLLAAYAAVELIKWLVRSYRVPLVLAAAVAAIALVGQSLVSVVHNDIVLSRADTRNSTRAWMVSHIPAGSKVVIEPVVPDNWAIDDGRSLPYTPTGERWSRFATWFSDVGLNGALLPNGQFRYVVVDEYERTLRPALLQNYIKHGYCWLVEGSLQAGRAFAAPTVDPQAIAYYGALAANAKLMYHISPFSSVAHPVPFSFDWSIDYYPNVYRLPGPEMSVYRLTGGKCGSG